MKEKKEAPWTSSWSLSSEKLLNSYGNPSSHCPTCKCKDTPHCATCFCRKPKELESLDAKGEVKPFDRNYRMTFGLRDEKLQRELVQPRSSSVLRSIGQWDSSASFFDAMRRRNELGRLLSSVKLRRDFDREFRDSLNSESHRRRFNEGSKEFDMEFWEARKAKRRREEMEHQYQQSMRERDYWSQENPMGSPFTRGNQEKERNIKWDQKVEMSFGENEFKRKAGKDEGVEDVLRTPEKKGREIGGNMDLRNFRSVRDDWKRSGQKESNADWPTGTSSGLKYMSTGANSRESPLKNEEWVSNMKERTQEDLWFLHDDECPHHFKGMTWSERRAKLKEDGRKYDFLFENGHGENSFEKEPLEGEANYQEKSEETRENPEEMRANPEEMRANTEEMRENPKKVKESLRGKKENPEKVKEMEEEEETGAKTSANPKKSKTKRIKEEKNDDSKATLPSKTKDHIQKAKNPKKEETKEVEKGIPNELVASVEHKIIMLNEKIDEMRFLLENRLKPQPEHPIEEPEPISSLGKQEPEPTQTKEENKRKTGADRPRNRSTSPISDKDHYYRGGPIYDVFKISKKRPRPFYILDPFR